FARSGSAIGGVALMQWGISDDVIFLAERVVSAVLLLAAISLLVYPTGIVLVLIGGAIAAEAYAITEFGGNPFYEYALVAHVLRLDRKSTRLNSSHVKISYAVFCLKKKNIVQCT